MKLPRLKNVALGIDIRNGRGIGELAHKLKEIEAAGIKYEILYLNASNRIFIKNAIKRQEEIILCQEMEELRMELQKSGRS